MKTAKPFILTALLLILSFVNAEACTSLIATGTATANGRPILWKHRDTGADDNFLYRVERPGAVPYVGLFNGADSLCLDEAWMGVNDAGFAIMNTVAYNLAPNDPGYADREGEIMALALGACRTVDDFEALLDSLPKPLGVQTNFGCIDAFGGAAYFETDDQRWVRFDAADSPTGVLVRTNFAESGLPGQGKGYNRYDNVQVLLGEEFAAGSLTPAIIIEGVSRSFYDARCGADCLETAGEYLADDDLAFVPRRSSTASIVVEGMRQGEPAGDINIWTVLGYPPVSEVILAKPADIPDDLLPSAGDGAHAPANLRALARRDSLFSQRIGGGRRIDASLLRRFLDGARAESLHAYRRQ